ncbi:uncharacterized protein BJ171DRAFT_303391 [Polychytrium aggregatum]|uniref:uncharacterized protein n=1 Tax=Polychytrium aggregatum TaxID=110093 RepID=UPI0022FE30E2|nr:uncharacterized protein BJ171DRAFT_303391 [Polychytrium aggregatum]KAI9193130.1 hypothetical protein BJ171DRAFT_303391 [Polychytrium aggregatum]
MPETLRIRLQFEHPLAVSQCLCSVPLVLLERSVEDLASHLAQKFGIDTDVALEIDGFELLSGDIVKGVVRENDLITVKADHRNPGATKLGQGSAIRKYDVSLGEPSADQPKWLAIDSKGSLKQPLSQSKVLDRSQEAIVSEARSTRSLLAQSIEAETCDHAESTHGHNGVGEDHDDSEEGSDDDDSDESSDDDDSEEGSDDDDSDESSDDNDSDESSDDDDDSDGSDDSEESDKSSDSEESDKSSDGEESEESDDHASASHPNPVAPTIATTQSGIGLLSPPKSQSHVRKVPVEDRIESTPANADAPLALGKNKRKQLQKMLGASRTHVRFGNELGAEVEALLQSAEATSLAPEKRVNVQATAPFAQVQIMNDDGTPTPPRAIWTRVELEDGYGDEVESGFHQFWPKVPAKKRQRPTHDAQQRPAQKTTQKHPSIAADSRTEPPEDYSKYPLVLDQIQVGSKIAFKILELSENYTPAISGYKTATVMLYNPFQKSYRLKCHSKPVQPGGRFEIDDPDILIDGRPEDAGEMDVLKADLIEVRLVDSTAE